MTGLIDDDLRATFRSIADVLIPAAEGMPAASRAGVAGERLDHVLSLRPDLREAFLRGLRGAAGQEPQAAARMLNRVDPVALATIGLVAAAGYYLDPRVRELIGYPGQEKVAIPAEPTLDYVENGMLEVVFDRGPIYRPTPS